MPSNFLNSYHLDERNYNEDNFSDSYNSYQEGLVIDPQPLPESTTTVKYNNVKHMFNRSYVETVTLSAGCVGMIVLIAKYSRN